LAKRHLRSPADANAAGNAAGVAASQEKPTVVSKQWLTDQIEESFRRLKAVIQSAHRSVSTKPRGQHSKLADDIPGSCEATKNAILAAIPEGGLESRQARQSFCEAMEGSVRPVLEAILMQRLNKGVRSEIGRVAGQMNQEFALPDAQANGRRPPEIGADALVSALSSMGATTDRLQREFIGQQLQSLLRMHVGLFLRQLRAQHRSMQRKDASAFQEAIAQGLEKLGNSADSISIQSVVRALSQCLNSLRLCGKALPEKLQALWRKEIMRPLVSVLVLKADTVDVSTVIGVLRSHDGSLQIAEEMWRDVVTPDPVPLLTSESDASAPPGAANAGLQSTPSSAAADPSAGQVSPDLSQHVVRAAGSLPEETPSTPPATDEISSSAQIHVSSSTQAGPETITAEPCVTRDIAGVTASADDRTGSPAVQWEGPLPVGVEEEVIHPSMADQSAQPGTTLVKDPLTGIELLVTDLDHREAEHDQRASDGVLAQSRSGTAVEASYVVESNTGVEVLCSRSVPTGTAQEARAMFDVIERSRCGDPPPMVRKVSDKAHRAGNGGRSRAAAAPPLAPESAPAPAGAVLLKIAEIAMVRGMIQGHSDALPAHLIQQVKSKLNSARGRRHDPLLSMEEVTAAVEQIRSGYTLGASSPDGQRRIAEPSPSVPAPTEHQLELPGAVQTSLKHAFRRMLLRAGEQPQDYLLRVLEEEDNFRVLDMNEIARRGDPRREVVLRAIQEHLCQEIMQSPAENDAVMRMVRIAFEYYLLRTRIPDGKVGKPHEWRVGVIRNSVFAGQLPHQQFDLILRDIARFYDGENTFAAYLAIRFPEWSEQLNAAVASSSTGATPPSATRAAPSSAEIRGPESERQPNAGRQRTDRALENAKAQYLFRSVEALVAAVSTELDQGEIETWPAGESRVVRVIRKDQFDYAWIAGLERVIGEAVDRVISVPSIAVVQGCLVTAESRTFTGVIASVRQYLQQEGVLQRYPNIEEHLRTLLTSVSGVAETVERTLQGEEMASSGVMPILTARLLNERDHPELPLLECEMDLVRDLCRNSDLKKTVALSPVDTIIAAAHAMGISGEFVAAINAEFHGNLPFRTQDSIDAVLRNTLEEMKHEFEEQSRLPLPSMAAPVADVTRVSEDHGLGHTNGAAEMDPETQSLLQEIEPLVEWFQKFPPKGERGQRFTRATPEILAGQLILFRDCVRVGGMSPFTRDQVRHWINAMKILRDEAISIRDHAEGRKSLITNADGVDHFLEVLLAQGPNMLIEPGMLTPALELLLLRLRELKSRTTGADAAAQEVQQLEEEGRHLEQRRAQISRDIQTQEAESLQMAATGERMQAGLQQVPEEGREILGALAAVQAGIASIRRSFKAAAHQTQVLQEQLGATQDFAQMARISTQLNESCTQAGAALASIAALGGEGEGEEIDRLIQSVIATAQELGVVLMQTEEVQSASTVGLTVSSIQQAKEQARAFIAFGREYREHEEHHRMVELEAERLRGALSAVEQAEQAQSQSVRAAQERRDVIQNAAQELHRLHDGIRSLLAPPAPTPC